MRRCDATRPVLLLCAGRGRSFVSCGAVFRASSCSASRCSLAISRMSAAIAASSSASRSRRSSSMRRVCAANATMPPSKTSVQGDSSRDFFCCEAYKSILTHFSPNKKNMAQLSETDAAGWWTSSVAASSHTPPVSSSEECLVRFGPWLMLKQNKSVASAVLSVSCSLPRNHHFLHLHLELRRMGRTFMLNLKQPNWGVAILRGGRNFSGAMRRMRRVAGKKHLDSDSKDSASLGN